MTPALGVRVQTLVNSFSLKLASSAHALLFHGKVEILGHPSSNSRDRELHGNPLLQSRRPTMSRLCFLLSTFRVKTPKQHSTSSVTWTCASSRKLPRRPDTCLQTQASLSQGSLGDDILDVWCVGVEDKDYDLRLNDLMNSDGKLHKDEERALFDPRGFTPEAELLNGRLALIGLAVALLIEIATGKTVIEQAADLFKPFSHILSSTMS